MASDNFSISETLQPHERMAASCHGERRLNMPRSLDDDMPVIDLVDWLSEYLTMAKLPGLVLLRDYTDPCR